jgi:hypothetical protein
MHPPSAICKSLYRLHPYLRLAWLGRDKKCEDELNPGNFALVQLYHNRDCGSYAEPATYREFWEVTPHWTEGGQLISKRIERGPIFNRHGGTTRDWDPLFRKPIFVQIFENTYDVFSGKIIYEVKYYMNSIVERIMKSAKDKGKRVKAHTQDLSREMSDYLLWEANKHTSSAPIMANKHARADYVNHVVNRRVDFEDAFMPPAPPRGVR